MSDNQTETTEKPKKKRQYRRPKGFMLKSELEGIIRRYKQENYDQQVELEKERAETVKWKQMAFISWVVSAVLIVIPLMIGVSKFH